MIDNATLAFTHLVLALLRARRAVESDAVAAVTAAEAQEQAVRDALAAMEGLKNELSALDIPNVSAVARFVCELEEAER